MKIEEIIAPKPGPTITSATGPNGQINRNTANKMVDPYGYFAKNKRNSKKKKK